MARRYCSCHEKGALFRPVERKIFSYEWPMVPKPSSSITLDSFDLAILRILQRDNTTPQRVIGETVGLSAPAVQRRIRRMEEAGGHPGQCLDH